MAMASYAIPNTLGGEISQFAQGRFDKPDYRTSMKVCFNGFPDEIGTWMRRPGTRFAGTTRGGAPGRVIKFDFDQSQAITLEFTEGQLRFRHGTTFVTSNDSQFFSSISAANPAVLNTSSVNSWQTNDMVIFDNLGTTAPLLQGRQFGSARIDGTHFSLFDEPSGVGIDGSTIGSISPTATVSRIQNLQTPYTSGRWANIRAVQAETTDILLEGTIIPQALTVATLPSTGVDPVFAIAPAVFNDGPYLDPFTNGVQANPNQKTGIVQISLSFPSYNAATAYQVGSFVTDSSVNYRSLVDQNVGHTPAASPAFWQAVDASQAIVPGGFLSTDIGRLVRFLSEPDLWSVTTTYAIGATISYNPTGTPGASTYWTSLVNGNIGNIPGVDITNWKIVPQNAAIWSWGKIVSLATQVPQATGAPLGSMIDNGGLAAAFDGNISKSGALSAQAHSTSNAIGALIGKNFSASPQRIVSATYFPPFDNGFAIYQYRDIHFAIQTIGSGDVTVNLRANMVAPGSTSDGTLLGSTGSFGNVTTPVSLTSNDQVTAWNYVWFEILAQSPLALGTPIAYAALCSQAQFFNPTGTSTTGNGINVELLGPPLLYTTPIRTWRLGVYSDNTGWPTCGIYNDGRLYLGGAVGNRFDASVSNGIVGGTVNFAPTDQFGVVAPSSAISYVFNSNGVNKILWMDSDLQGIKMGTQAGEWLVVAPTAGSIAPNNISARNVTGHGSANVQPCRTEHTTIFVQRYSRKLLEYFPDVYSGKFSAPNLADKAEHIVRSGVAELAYTSSATPVVWGRCNDGSLFGITYKRDSLVSAQPATFYGWHRHALGTGRVVESVCAGPSVGGSLDTLTMVTNDATTGIRHVELLTDAMDELTPLSQAWFLDDAVVPTSTVVGLTGLTLNGLWHLNGKTVQVFAGGLDCGDPGEGKPIADFLVTNGSCVVPFGDGISAGSGRGLFTADFVATGVQIVVGLTYTSDGQLTRPILQADTGARSGPGFAKLSRGHRIGMQLVNTLGLSVGADFTKRLYPAKFTKADGVTAIPQLTTYSGIFQDTLQDDYTYDAALCWRITRPFPANVVAVGSNLATQDQ